MKTDRAEEKHFVDRVRKLASKLDYPINDRDALVKSFGGSDAKVEWAGQKHHVRQAVQIIPDYYFPVDSEEDLIVKAVNLEMLRQGTDLPPENVGPEQDPEPGRKPPRAEVGRPPAKPSHKEGGPALVVGERKNKS